MVGSLAQNTQARIIEGNSHFMPTPQADSVCPREARRNCLIPIG
jgi:hypothetical protein